MVETNNVAFNPDDWDKCIATEDGEVAYCEFCHTISEPAKKGEHIMCKKCNKYIWRKKPGK